MDDPVLGTLHEEEGRLEGEVPFAGNAVSVRVDPDNGDINDALATARGLVSSLADVDRKAKEAAADKLLDKYNNGWRTYDEVAEDGTLVNVENPVLSGEEFMARLSLYAVNVTGKDTCDLFYNNEGMFWGHSIVVGSFDASHFADIHVQLFG